MGYYLIVIGGGTAGMNAVEATHKLALK